MFRIAAALLCAAMAHASAASAAEAYPQKPIRLVVPFAPGGGTDLLARFVSDRLAGVLGTSIVVENRSGAGGTIGTGLVARAPADGYTFLFTSASYTFAPNFYPDLPYDPVKDFKPITTFGSTPNLLAVHPSMPVRSLKQLLALARKRPGEILYGHAGRGSNVHLTTELFMYMARIKLVPVAYKGAGPAQIGLMSGEVHVLLPGIQSAYPVVKSGRIRALAVTTKQRAQLLPDVPTIDEAGVPGYEKAGWFGLFAPAAVPEDIVSRVYQAVARVLKNPDTVTRLAAEGAVVGGEPPAEFTAFVHSELAQWAKLIREMKL